MQRIQMNGGHETDVHLRMGLDISSRVYVQQECGHAGPKRAVSSSKTVRVVCLRRKPFTHLGNTNVGRDNFISERTFPEVHEHLSRYAVHRKQTENHPEGQL